MLATKNATIGGPGLNVQPSGGPRYSMPQKIVASAWGSDYVVIGGRQYRSPVIVRASGNVISCGQYSYEGELVLRAVNSDLQVINRLDIEKYLRGVLGYEVNPNWPLEALKAQAVISRTYALAQLGRHNSQGYDVCTGDHCQIYKGTAVHNPNTDRAIAQTMGKALIWNGALAQTFFCSDNGGASSDVKDVWGKPIPYLIVRKEPYPSDSPKSNWQTTLTAREIENAIAKKGIHVGMLKSMEISRRDSAGRPVGLTFKGTSGTATLPTSQFRMAVGAKNVRSTFFEFAPISEQSYITEQRHPAQTVSVTKNATPAVGSFKSADKNSYSTELLTQEEQVQLNALIEQNVFTLDERIDMLSHPERRRYYLERTLGKTTTVAEEKTKSHRRARRKKKKHKIEEVQPEKVEVVEKPAESTYRVGPSSVDLTSGTVTLYGKGWGHGVGLSQYGAKAMAEHGWSVEKILEYYYPGTKLIVRSS